MSQRSNRTPTRSNQQAVAMHSTTMMRHSGPLPPADDFRTYEEVLPGAAERMLCMAEQQQSHRIANDENVVNRVFKLETIGQIFGFIVTILALAASCLIPLLTNKNELAIIPGLFAIANIVAAFTGRSGQKQSRQNT